METFPVEESPHNFDIPGYWGSDIKYPTLYLVARSIFCIPSSSAKSEMTFSAGGNTITDKRSRLDPGKVNDLLIIKDNADIVIFK